MNAPLRTPLLAPAQQAQPHLYEMRPGALFRVSASNTCTVPAIAQRGVLALLSHFCTTVSDATRIWCVVIAAEPADGVPGEMVSLPRDVLIERLYVVGPMPLSREH
jgi:hypothetical protein